MFGEILNKIRQRRPLIHHITNIVTTNDCANVTLAIGGLPVMVNAVEEVEDMVSSAQALVLNIGTLTTDQVDVMIKAGKKANSLGIPVILDPVGAGATEMRTKAARRILNEVQISVVKGNNAEVSVLAKSGGKIRGVESEEKQYNVQAYKELSHKYECVVGISGEKDIVVKENEVNFVYNGHPLMSKITGTGCMLSSVIACFCAVEQNYFTATIGAMVSFGISGELAAKNRFSLGPASFKTNFFDEIYNLSKDKVDNGKKIVEER